MKYLLTKILICFTLLITMCACSSSTSYEVYNYSSIDLGFDTLIQFQAYATSKKEFETYKKIVQDTFVHYDALFNKYDSFENIQNIRSINELAISSKLKVDKDIISLLKYAKEYSELTNNQFDITMGSVLNLWHNTRTQALENNDDTDNRIPLMSDLKKADQHKGFKHIQIDDKNNTIYLDDPKVSLDVGGIAKGYAVQKCVESLQKAGLKHGFINAGGNVKIIGNKPSGDMFRVGLQIPSTKQLDTSSLISLNCDGNTSIVTSGDYQRYYMVEGKMMHHIIDPDTLMPARHAKSVSIITEDSTLADALSTAFFNMSYEEGTKLLKELKKKYTLDVIWVFDQEKEVLDDHSAYNKKGYQIIVSHDLIDKMIP